MTREQFLNIFTFVSASNTTSSSATFNNVKTIYLSDTYKTTLDNSLFFINGVHIYSKSIASIENINTDMVVTFDTASLEYIIESTDEVTAQGKFELI